MTPKEKAEDLFSKFIDEIPPNQEKDINKFMEVDREATKQCALIAVDEILLSRKDDSQFDDTLWAGGSDMYTMHPMYLNYWLEVKKEIEKI